MRPIIRVPEQKIKKYYFELQIQIKNAEIRKLNVTVQLSV